MSTQQAGKPQKKKRSSIFSGKLRTTTIILGFIFFAVCAFFWFRGIDNDQVNKIMGAIFTILTGVCAFLSIPFLNRSEDAQAPSSFQTPALQINNNNNIYQIQSNTEQTSLPLTSASDIINSKEQGWTSGSNLQPHQQLSFGEAPFVKDRLINSVSMPHQVNSTSSTLLHLSFEEKTSLAEKLLACSSLQRKEARETITKQLSSKVADKIERHSSTRWDIISIIDTCLEYPGSLEELITIIRFFEGNSISMQRLDSFMNALSKRS